MLKEMLSKFGTIRQINNPQFKESYVLMLDLHQIKPVYINIDIDENNVMSINNKDYPILINEEKLEFLKTLFDEEYTIRLDFNKFFYEVKAKGNYFPMIYLNDIHSFYEDIINQFGSL